MGSPSTEGDVGIRRAGDVEAEGIAEDLLVAVRRRIPEREALALGDLHASDLGVAGRPAREVRDRRGPAQDLLHRGPQRGRIPAQALELLGVIEKREQALRDRIAGRLAARQREQHEEEVQLGRAQGGPHAVVGFDLDRREQRPDVVLRALALASAELLSVLEHAGLDRDVSLRGEAALGVSALEEVAGEFEEPRTVFDGNAHDVGDHVHRKLVGDILHEVAGSALASSLDDGRRPAACLLFESADHAGGESRADQPALAQVCAAVHADEHLSAHRRGPGERGPVVCTEALGVAIRGLDVRMPREHPEAGVRSLADARGKTVPEDRGLAAERREQCVREAVAVVRRIAEVEGG